MTAGLTARTVGRPAQTAGTKHDISAQIGALFVALFISAGLLKELPFLAALPIDFTVLSTLLVASLGAYRLTRKAGMAIPSASFLVPAFFISTLPVFFWSSFGEYTVLKAGSFIAFTLVASFFAPLVITTRSAFTSVLGWLLVLAVGMSIDALVLRGGPDGFGRLVSLGNGIALGRATAQGAVFLFVVGLWKPKRVWLVLPVVSLLLLAMLGSGNRSSFSSLPVAIVLVAILSKKLHIPVVVRVTLLISSIALMFYLMIALAPEDAVLRLTDTSQLGASGRDELYQAGFELLPDVPLGIGWGDWGEKVDVFSGDIRLYPHNIFLEVGVELGWLSLVVLMAIIVVAFRSLIGQIGTFEGEAMLGVLAFVLLTTQVSGDLTDNRHFFVLLTLAKHLESLPLQKRRRVTGAPPRLVDAALAQVAVEQAERPALSSEISGSETSFWTTQKLRRVPVARRNMRAPDLWKSGGPFSR